MEGGDVLDYKGMLKYLNLSNKEAVTKFFGGSGQKSDELVKSDLISGVYEGGLKVWECSFDLIEHLHTRCNSTDSAQYLELRGKRILELGCG